MEMKTKRAARETKITEFGSDGEMKITTMEQDEYTLHPFASFHLGSLQSTIYVCVCVRAPFSVVWPVQY